MKSAAIIGCGKPRPAGTDSKEGWAIAYAHADGYRSAFPDIVLYAVDPNADNLKAFAEKHALPAERCFASTEALYAAVTPEAASICTWPALHAPQGLEAIRNGVRATTIEKPVALDGFQIQELISVAAQQKARVAVAHQRRYEPWFEKARELIRRGVLGEKLVIEGRVGDNWDILSWTTHWFDMANFLFDGPPTSVLAGVDHRGERRYGHAVENASVVFADYNPDRQAVFVTGPAAIPFPGVTVRGERGMMTIGNSIKLWTTDGYREEDCADNTFTSAYGALFADLWAMHDGGVSRCDLSLCAVATQMAYAVHESARTQKRVSLPLKTLFAPLEVLQHPPVISRRKLTVVVLGDQHHEWPGMEISGRLGLIDALQSMGHEVISLEASGDIAADAFAGADVLALYHTQQKTPLSHRGPIENWFKAGKPVVVSHCGIGPYADWPEFRRWVGNYWVWGGEDCAPSKHPHVPCKIRVDDPERFTVAWSEGWLPTDEMYQSLGEAAPVRVLATGIAPDGHEQAFAWQVIDHPNVVAWLPGHRRDMFSLPVVIEGLRAAIDLAIKHGR